MALLRTQRIAVAQLLALADDPQAPLAPRGAVEVYRVPTGYRAIVKDVRYSGTGDGVKLSFLTLVTVSGLQVNVAPVALGPDAESMQGATLGAVLEAGDQLVFQSFTAPVTVYVSGAVMPVLGQQLEVASQGRSTGSGE